MGKVKQALMALTMDDMGGIDHEAYIREYNPDAADGSDNHYDVAEPEEVNDDNL